MKSPAFQFYPGDFLSDLNVIVMSGAEVGAYALLMSVCWIENGFPNDMDDMAHVAKMDPNAFAESWSKRLSRCFLLREDGKWDHPRLQAERVKQQAFSQKMSEAGARGGRGHKAKVKPAQRVGEAEALGTQRVGNALQSPSSSPSSNNNYTADFDLLWKAYPKRHGGSNKVGSYRCFLGHLKAGVAYDVMLEGVKRYALKCLADASVGTKYVKDCKTFLGPDKYFLDDHDIGPGGGGEGVLPISREAKAAKQFLQRGYVRLDGR